MLIISPFPLSDCSGMNNVGYNLFDLFRLVNENVLYVFNAHTNGVSHGSNVYAQEVTV